MPSASKRKKNKEREAERDRVARTLKHSHPTWAAQNVKVVNREYDVQPASSSSHPMIKFLLASTTPCSQADATTMDRLAQTQAMSCEFTLDPATACIFASCMEREIEQVVHLFQQVVDNEAPFHRQLTTQHVSQKLSVEPDDFESAPDEDPYEFW
ncbi:hypothetical protein MN608_03841 [Microdochium nivale]|nr:hypothetical protein MN608_03841 [Microdochium nivale]